MSREERSLVRRAALLGALCLTVPARAGSIDDLKARGQKVTDPDEARDTARLLRRAGLLPEALGALRRGMAKARGNDAIAAIRLEIARTYIEQRLPKKALNECDQLHKLQPLAEQLCIAEGQLLNRRGSTALPAAEEALKLSPGDYDAMVAKGRALGQLGRPADAEAAFRAAIAAAANRPEAHRFLGELFIGQGRTEAALVPLREAKRVAPDDPDSLVLLGETLGSGQEARAAFEHALEVRPGFSRARARLGNVLLASGDLDGAEKMLTQALAEDPKQADWLASLGEVQVAKNQPEAALKSAHAALKIVQNHGAAKLVEADALARKGDIDLAVEAYETAYGYSRLTPKALLSAARACKDAGRLTTARAFADRATEDFPKQAIVWEVLGDVAAAQKDGSVAKKAYDRALGGEGSVDKDGIRKKRAAVK